MKNLLNVLLDADGCSGLILFFAGKLKGAEALPE